MDPLLLKRVADELNASLTGAVVSKVHQPDDRTIVLKLFTGGSAVYLLISTHPRLQSLHLTNEDFENPLSPKRFCAYLRSRITNARVGAVRVLEGQRIAFIDLKRRRESGEETVTLIAEFTGKSANVILVDSSGVVQDSLRYFRPQDSPRPVAPGLPLAQLPTAAPEKAGEFIAREEGESWNECAARLYLEAVQRESYDELKRRLRRVLSDAEKRLKRKIDNLNADKLRAETEAGFSKLGDMLIRNLSKIKKGESEVRLDDYTLSPPVKVKIPLEPKLSPRENAERYFKRAKKSKLALEMLSRRLPETEKELEYVAGLAYEWERAEGRGDLKEVEAELIEEGYIKRPSAASSGRGAPKEPERAEPVRRLKSSEGFEMLCGKSGAGNDLIVKRLATDEDIWLHALGVPGSHVLIKTAGRAKEMTVKTIEEAAGIAAYYSKARESAKAEVIYTEARNVKKPKGAKPGMVTVSGYKTILARPRGGEIA